MGKPKMCNISKTVIRRTKRTGLGVIQYTCFRYLWYPIPWAWFRVIRCTLQNFQTMFLSQFSSDSSKRYATYHNHTGCHFFGDLPKTEKKYGILNFFLTKNYMELEFSQCYFSHNFHWSLSKLYDNIGYHSKSKCLLEYCNEKLASSI